MFLAIRNMIYSLFISLNICYECSKELSLYPRYEVYRGYIVFIPRHKVWRGIMLYPSVSVRPSAPFPIDNLSIYSRNFFKFCIHIVNGDEWYGIVNGQNPAIFNAVTALFRIGKMVSGLLFLYCS